VQKNHETTTKTTITITKTTSRTVTQSPLSRWLKFATFYTERYFA